MQFFHRQDSLSESILSDPETFKNLDYDSDRVDSAGPDAAPAVTTVDCECRDSRAGSTLDRKIRTIQVPFT